MDPIRIEELKEDGLGSFWGYLSIHLSENGNNDFYFQPLSKEQSLIGDDWEEKFRSGFGKQFGEIGWRKLWIAINSENQIMGHIDIRSRRELNSEHRVLLRMGTDSNFRNMKVAQRLLQFVIDHCVNQPEISWLDLEVLANNAPAIYIYEKLNFQVVGSIMDMFRIENRPYDYTAMTLNVDPDTQS